MKKSLIVGLSVILLFSSVFAFSNNDELLNDSAVKLIKPKYPLEAKKANAQGEVKIKVTVDENGKVNEAEAISGNELLTEGCVEAALNSTFKIRKIDGKPAKYSGVIVYNFRIS